MSSVMEDLLSPTKEPPIIDNPLQFKYKLGLGDAAYEYLSKADNFLKFSKLAVAGLGGSSFAGLGWLATLTPVAKFALLFGLTSTPVGWMVGAGALSTVLAYALIKQEKSLKDKVTITIPKYLSTPLDLLAQTVLSLIMPAIVKMALADGCLCEKEGEHITNYFVKEWGFNREFVANAIHEQESLIFDFDYNAYREVLLASTCTNKEIKYEVIKKELFNILTEVMYADELVSTEELQELELLHKIINEPGEAEDSISGSILDSIKRRKASIIELVNSRLSSDNKPIQADTERLEDRLFEKLRQLDDHCLNSVLLSGLRVPKNKLINLNREERILVCSKELRSAAGSSTRNIFRSDHEFPYKQILIDVADRLVDGFTPLSWTKYKLGDPHTEQEIEDTIIEVFEERARKWWEKLPEKKKNEFISGLQSVLDGENIEEVNLAGGVKTFLTQQLIDSIIQNGVTLGLTQLSAPGLYGALGVSLVGHIGWQILVQTLGLMTGIKIAIFGIGGMGTFGGAVSFLGATAVGGALSIPSTLLAMDGTAYRKTIPTIIMLLTMSRGKNVAHVSLR